jgi:cysteine desulfurase/selenocysteine lyase
VICLDVIYLDHAATSWPKPPAVLAAVQRWFTDVGVSSSRGAGDRCRLAALEVDAARAAVGALTGVPERGVAFTSGATEGLNLALRALLRPGDTVLTTAFEHSSVVRPLRVLQRERALRVEVLAPRADGTIATDDVRGALAAHRPALLVFAHASNVTGAGVDAAAWCELARATGTTTLLDASQTAGLADVRVGADVLVASAHKALHGPPGLGFVATALELAPQKHGGTGSSVALEEHPTQWPGAFEAGTPNTPAIFGLGEALRCRPAAVRAADAAHALAAADELADGLRALPGVTVFAPRPATRVPVLSFVHAGHDPAELGALLAAHDVHARAGHHCAPWLHAHLGTAAAGTVRLSPGPATTADEVRRVLELARSLG